VLGHFGAAAAASLAMGEPASRVAQAMAIAATGASGLIAAFGTMAKSLQLGRTAAGGVLAAYLANRGSNGPTSLLDTPAAFAVPLTGDSGGDFAQAAADWGDPYAIVANSFKPHASCMITHPAIDAAVRLRALLVHERAKTADIAEIACSVNVLAPRVAGIARPATGLEGKFSVAYCVVASLLDGRATPELFSDEAVARPVVSALLERTTVVPDAAIGEKQAEVTLLLQNGRRLVERIDMAKGHPGNPMSDDELAAKFLSLVEPVRGERAKALLDDLWRLHERDDSGACLRPHLDLTTNG
jgi:2-methylcitrate dehydratase PrpD